MKLDIIINPIVTEKTAGMQEKGIYTFLVRKEATKIDVKRLLESLYGEKVESVKVNYIQKKERIVGRGKIMTKRPKMKRAMVTFKGKKQIDLLKFEKEAAPKKKKAS
jgi:large subunit ribosomal protein L23